MKSEPMYIKSPLTGKFNAVIERRIPTSFLIKEYKSSYDIDVSDLVGDLESVDICRCEDTGFRFYWPAAVAGDGPFYEALQEFPWYYMEWKWEHQKVNEIISSKDKLLEIGCAKGSFLQRMMDRGLNATGLELNHAAAKEGKDEGRNILTETIQEHAEKCSETYDVVCSFQVMEHIADVKSIIEASVKALKTGGKLIISVPNNDSFIKDSPNSIMNMPPHHMCLWDKASLTQLENLFPIKVINFYYEPLQEYHYPVIWSNAVYKYIKPKFLAKAVNKVSKWFSLHKLVAMRKEKVKGHSIVAVYIKK